MKRLAPSKLAYLEKCPRYKPAPGTSEAAERGTAMHLAMETGSRIGLEPDEVDAVELCERYVQNILTRPTVVKVYREVRLRAMQLNRQVVEGTADFVVIHDTGTIDVVDYKFGLAAIEDAETNLQGQCYVLGAFRRWRCPLVRVHFLMPRQGEVSTSDYYPEDIARIRLRLLTLAALLRKRKRPHTPNEFSCQWCGNKDTCPGLARKAMILSGRVGYEGLRLPQVEDLAIPLTPETRGRLQSLATILSDWCSQVKKANAEYLNENPEAEIPGFKLVSRRGNRTLIDSLLTAQFLRGTGATDDRIIAGCSLKVSEVESILVEQAPGARNREPDETDEEWVARAMDALETTGLVQRGANVTYLKKVKAQKELN